MITVVSAYHARIAVEIKARYRDVSENEKTIKTLLGKVMKLLGYNIRENKCDFIFVAIIDGGWTSFICTRFFAIHRGAYTIFAPFIIDLINYSRRPLKEKDYVKLYGVIRWIAEDFWREIGLIESPFIVEDAGHVNIISMNYAPVYIRENYYIYDVSELPTIPIKHYDLGTLIDAEKLYNEHIKEMMKR